MTLIIGERINGTGSRAVARMLLAGDDDGLAAIARAQVEAGAHALDVCVALEGHQDEPSRMARVIARLARSVEVPLAIDSTDPLVIERALDELPRGRGIVNSLNIAGRTTAARLVPLAMEQGAPLVALCIDEQGMARTRQRKLAIARRLYEEIVDRRGVAPEALLIDALTFPLETDGADAMIETIEGVRLIKRELPDVRTILGIPDVSFGLAPRERAAVNAGFLRRCVEAGLDAAIVNPAHVCDSTAAT
jgi:5-methyltetrahydrofolate--homocysteine methyltransferase